MDKHDRFGTLDHRSATPRNLLQLGLWLRGALVGAAFAVAGLVALIDPPRGLSFLTALTWLAAGGTFAWLASQRATALLDRMDPAEPATPVREPALLVRRLARAPETV